MSSSRLRVLAVDACQDTTWSLAQFLRLWGHEAHVAHDGPSALRLAGEIRPEVVLLEPWRAGLGGWELALQLRQVPGMDEALLVAVTVLGREQDRRRSREAGIDLHLVKPVEPGLLREALALWSVPCPVLATGDAGQP